MSIDERGAAARKALGAKTARGYFLDPARRPLAALLAGAACLGLVALLHGLPRLAPAYLAAWTCLLALPAGALPVAIMIERADAWRPQPETALLETLRGLLALMPVAALLALPIPFLAPFLYPWAQGSEAGPGPAGAFAALWFSRPAFAGRLALYFGLWIGLALLFARRGGEPWGKAGRIDDGRAVLGLGVHTVVGTLAADDLVMAVDGRFHAAAFGLLAMAAWSSLALAAAIVIAPPDIGPARRRHDRMTPLAVLLLVSAGLHAVQFLMLGPEPNAAAWYGVRGGPAGRALMLTSGLVVALAAALTLRPGENRTRLVAALAVAAHLAEMAWFVTPSFAGLFRIGVVDLLALAGVAGLAIGLTPPLRRLFPGLAVTPAWPGREAASAARRTRLR